ncbi:MAG: PKD domain-containing protein [Cryobacterium sp.]
MIMNTFKLPGIFIGAVAALMLAACGGGGGGGGTTTNRAPIANAGPAQSVTTGMLVTLDGRASSDADGDPLTYAWTLPTRPTGSTATLSGATTAQPTFTADMAGTYTASLVVSDGTVNSAPATVTITATAPSTAPVADAGPDQSVIVPAVVTLDGTGSTTAAPGATLTYAWTLPTRPPGSTATISNPANPMPTFTADVEGTYVASLVVNDGATNSAPSTVTITGSTANAPPVANAGPDQNVTIPATVTLNGAGSSDPDGDALAYSWSFTSRPTGSTATLAGATTVSPNFQPDVAGVYQVRLVVNDGQVNSTPDTVTITAATGNSAPIADAGPAQQVVVGDTVTLDGSASSDADGDALTYAWSLTTQPTGSAATLANPTTASPTFSADVAGVYVASLVVNDGTLDSAPDTVSVTAFANNVIGEPYLARNDITVTLDAFTVQDLGNGFIRYTATYTQENKTAAPILEGSLRLYFTNASPVNQFIFPTSIQPGGTLNRTYEFDVLSSSEPLLLQYDGDHQNAEDPIFEAVQWRFPIQ